VRGWSLPGCSLGPDGHGVTCSLEGSDGACYNMSTPARSHRGLMGAALSAVGLVNYPTAW
jgi:D-alanyl-D-alanine dipeptidase